jgi:hypothetical protein
MKDRTNRRLLIIFGLCLLLSIGGIAIGILGIIDLLDTDFISEVAGWFSPIISIRQDGPLPDDDAGYSDAPTAMDIEATRLAEEQGTVEALYADWPIVFEETFDSNESGWPEFEDQDSLAELTVQIQNGVYRWEALANDGFVWWSYPDMNTFSEFYAEVDAFQSAGDQYGEVGLIFRLDEDRFYLFELSAEFYSLWRSVPDGWERIIDWTTSDAILQGEVNQMGVLAIQDQIHLFVNGRLVAEVEDAHYDAGVIGVAIGLDEAGFEGVFEFDNLLVSAPP